jgi:potassium large conductance calcium-activated channel subfamily M alpha protein 1
MSSQYFPRDFNPHFFQDVTTTLSPEEAECLKDRKWWAFLLSSLFTFLAGIFIVLIYRLIEFLCTGTPSVQHQNAPNANKLKAPHPEVKTTIINEPLSTTELGWMTEAKDWAGELISGQSTTGRILR